MDLNIPLILKRTLRISVLVVAASLLVGCAGTPGPGGINDPYEESNRKIHDFNKGIDKALVGPASKGVGVIPGPVTRAVGNVADTLSLPNDIVNNILQLRVIDASENTLRLAVNLTAGLAGLVDVSSVLGIEGKPTDFGETLYVWGVGEGPYVELPLIGPSTTRDAVGTAVDFVLDPVWVVLPKKEAIAAKVLRLFSRLGDRGRYSATVDSILYDSADSYAQSRLLYLQNRRFELGQSGGAGGAEGTSDDDFIDPYEDPYAE